MSQGTSAWLSGWLNQSVSWERDVTDPDEPSPEWEGRTFAAPVAIAARKEELVRERASFGGTEVRQAYTIWVGASPEIAVGDRVDNEIVQARQTLLDLGGTIVGYELRTERQG